MTRAAPTEIAAYSVACSAMKLGCAGSTVARNARAIVMQHRRRASLQQVVQCRGPTRVAPGRPDGHARRRATWPRRRLRRVRRTHRYDRIGQTDGQHRDEREEDPEPARQHRTGSIAHVRILGFLRSNDAVATVMPQVSPLRLQP